MAVIDGDDSRLSGVQLLALYGEEEEIGAFMPGLKRAAKKAGKFTPHYLLYRGGRAAVKGVRRRLHGDFDDRLGAFLPGLRKVGKVTSGFTSGVAQAIGVPKSTLAVLSKFDPTKKKASLKRAVKAITPQKAIVPVKKEMLDVNTKKVLIVAGSGIGALVLLKLLMGMGRQSRPY